MRDSYGIRSGYHSNLSPTYDDQHVESDGRTVWQPDVYADAGKFAQVLESPAIIDIGTGNGEKLVRISSGRVAIGLDFGANIDAGEARQRSIDWRRYDADVSERLPLTHAELDGAVIVCADVVEHLIRPERLMRELRRALDHVALIVISTPDRARLRGADDMGPPGNSMHVREWSMSEWVSFLATCGFQHGVVRHTRENDVRHDHRTIEAILAPVPETLGRIGLPASPGLSVRRPEARLLVVAGRFTRRVLRRVRRSRASVAARPGPTPWSPGPP